MTASPAEMAAFIEALPDDLDHVEIFRRCAERFPDALKGDFIIALQIVQEVIKNDLLEDPKA